MATELLVEDRTEEGQRLIDQLVRDEFEVGVALWVKRSEEGLWSLYIGSSAVDPDKPAEAYRRVYAALDKVPDTWVTPADIMLFNSASPVARAAVEARDRNPRMTPTRYRRKRLGNLDIEEAYIYPPPRKWFQGFDEIKQNFPSAEVFTLPIRPEAADAAKLDPYMGRINAAEFEGRAPGTVLCFGPKGSSGKPIAELYFVHRPEGWNTLYRADTGKYEEVRHLVTNEPLYRSADFGPLAALKT